MTQICDQYKLARVPIGPSDLNMPFVKPEPRIKEERSEDSSQIPVFTTSDPASVHVKQEKHYDGGGVEGIAPARSSFQHAAASSSSSSSRWVGAPGKAKQEPQATVTQVKKKSGVRKRPHGMIYNEVKRRVKGNTPLKCEAPPKKESLPNRTAGWVDPEMGKVRVCATERDSGLRYIYWEKARPRWVVKYRFRGVLQKPVFFYIRKWCAEGYAFEEAVAMALEEAKAHLAKVRDRPSGARGITWNRRDWLWCVRVILRSKIVEQKHFSPKDKSDEEVARALKEAAAHAAKVQERYGVLPWKDKSAKALEDALKKARAHLSKRPAETRGVTWHKHDLAWRVKLDLWSPRKRTKHSEDKRFYPKDTSDEEMLRTLEEARAHLMKLRARSSGVEDKPFNKSGIRGVTWHKRYFAWRVRLVVPSAAGKRSKRIEFTCFRPKNKSDEAVARALKKATAHLTKMRGRLSGVEDKKHRSGAAVATASEKAKAHFTTHPSRVCGVNWSEREFCWRVRFEPRSAGKRMWVIKRFYPKDKSKAAIEEARQEAVQWRRKLEARHQLFSTAGGRVLSKRGCKGLMAAGGRARSKRERQQEG